MLPRYDRLDFSSVPASFAEIRNVLEDEDDLQVFPGMSSIRGKTERDLAALLQDPGHGTLFRLQRALERMPHSVDD